MGYHLAPKSAPKRQIDAIADTVAVVNAKSHTDTLTARVRISRKAVATRSRQLDSVLQVTEAVAPQTAPDSLIAMLDTLSKTARLYQFEVLRYQGFVDTLLLTHQAERVALTLQEDALRSALHDAENRARCSAFGIPCPTRWQAFAIGFGVAATILVLR